MGLQAQSEIVLKRDRLRIFNISVCFRIVSFIATLHEYSRSDLGILNVDRSEEFLFSAFDLRGHNRQAVFGDRLRSAHNVFPIHVEQAEMA